MPKRRLIVILLAAAGLALGISFAIRAKGPFYKGRPLSHWVRLYCVNGIGADVRERQANEAIKHIGTNALPHLLNWVRTEDPPWTNKFYQLAERLPDPIRPQLPVRYGAPDAFAALGYDARRAVPELAKLAHDTNHLRTAAIATMCLGKISLEDISPLLALLTNEHAFIRGCAWDAIRDQGTNAATAIPFLVRDFKADQRGFKASRLGALATEPDLVVPALTNALFNPAYRVRAAAAAALGAYGPQASSAAPTVITLLNDPNREVRSAATNALLKIAPEALTNALSQ